MATTKAAYRVSLWAGRDNPPRLLEVDGEALTVPGVPCRFFIHKAIDPHTGAPTRGYYWQVSEFKTGMRVYCQPDMQRAATVAGFMEFAPTVAAERWQAGIDSYLAQWPAANG